MNDRSTFWDLILVMCGIAAWVAMLLAWLNYAMG